MCKRNTYGFSVGLSSTNSNNQEWDENDSVLGLNRIRNFRKAKNDIPSNIPRLLLRQFFQCYYDKNPILKYIFCDFNETVKALQTKDIDFKKQLGPAIKNNKTMYVHSHDVLLKMLENDENYNIIRALICRIHESYKLIEDYSFKEEEEDDITSDFKAKKILFLLQLFIDTHLPLLDYIKRNDEYTDEQLNDPDVNLDDLTKSALEQYFPSDFNVAYCGGLPDLIPCIDAGNVWYDVRPKLRIETITSALIHILACKTQSHKCQLRNFMRILYGYFKIYPIMIKLFKMMLQVSFMGNYIHAKYRPSLKTRLSIYNSFNSNKLTDDTLFLWMIENDQLVYYVTKEFYKYMVETQHVLDQVMEETTHWKEIKKGIVNAMDMARTAIDNDKIEDVNTFSNLDKDMKRNHQNMLSFITKLRKADFLEMMIQQMNKVHEKIAVNKKSTDVQTSEMILISYDTDPNKKNIIKTILDLQFIVDERFTARKQTKLELRWLKCFGISKIGYDSIRSLYFDYECRDIADNGLGRRITEIYNVSSYDFHLIRVFFQMIYEKRLFAEFKLSIDYAERHRAVLRAKYCIEPWEDLPDDIDLFYYCTICHKWGHSIVDPLTPKTKLNIYTQGLERTLYDHRTNKIYCGKQNTSMSIKKLMDSELFYKIGEIDDGDIKSARIIRKYKEIGKCCDTPLKSQHMIGICKKLGGKLWALCEICGCLTQWEGAKFSNIGFTCERHFSTKNNPIVIESQNCYYCGIPVPDFARKIKVLQDDNFEYRYITITLCRSDFAKSKWLFEDDIIVLKSKLFNSIQRSILIDGMKDHIKKPMRIR